MIRFFVVVLFALIGLGNAFAEEMTPPTEVLNLRFAPQAYSQKLNWEAKQAASIAAWKQKEGREIAAWKAKEALEVAAWKQRVIAEHAALMKIRTQHYELYLQWCDLRVQHEGALLHEASLDTETEELEKRPEFKNLVETRLRTRTTYSSATETARVMYQNAVNHIKEVYQDELDAIEKRYSPSL